ncbi:MAG: HEAT repeat domain-containing protein [Janthinobacterium lividum]
MKTLILLLFCLFCLLSEAGSAYAQFDGNPEVPVLVQNADTICVVKVAAITNITPTQFEAVHHDRNGLPVFIDAQSAVAEAVVQNVLAGKTSQKQIQISFFKNVRHGFNPSPFTELAAGETDIVFLEATPDDTHFALSQPTSHGKSKITIGDAKIEPLPPNTSPLRAVLLVLVNAVDNGSEPIKLECLSRIGSVGYVLDVKTGVYQDEGAVAIRAKLGEPLIADNVPISLERFVNNQILPAVLKLTADKDDKIREQAFLTAGYLQDVEVIPELVKIADNNSDAGLAIYN